MAVSAKNLLLAAIASVLFTASASAQVGAILGILGGGYSAGRAQQEKERMAKEGDAWRRQQEAERIERDALQDAAHAEREARIEAQRIKDEQAAEERTRAIVGGKIKPSTVDDLIDLYDTEDGWDLAASPKIKPDRVQYVISGTIARHESDAFLICETVPEANEFRGNYFGVRISKKTKKATDILDKMRINGRLFVVGKYTRNMDYTTVAMGQKKMPIFEADHLIVPEDDE